MLENVNAVSEDPDGTEDPDRIDALLSTALADQARERRMLVETVFGAKSALVKAEEEIAGLRELINKRDDALLDAVAKNNEVLLEAVSERVEAMIRAQPQPKIQPARDAGLTLRIEAIEDAILQLAQRIAGISQLPEQLRSDLEISAVAIVERIGEESSSLLADLREDQVEVVKTLAAMSETTVRELKQTLARMEQEMMERVASTGRDTIEAERSTVEQMVQHLTGYLHERDEQLYRARDQRLIELFQHLSDTISRTTRRKLGKMLAESENPTPAKPLAPPMPPAKEPPPLSVPRNFRQSAGEETEAAGSPFPASPGSVRRVEPAEPQPSFDRPDPAFAFQLPAPPGSVERPAVPLGRGEPPFGRPDQPFRDPAAPPFGRLEASANQALANPLTRAELVRDYLIESPSEMFSQEAPSRPAPGVRRKPVARGEEESGAKPKPGRPPKPPASPRGRRKA